MAVQVARVARAHTLDALAAQAERLAMLRALGQLDLCLAGQRGHGDVAAERGQGQRDRYGAVQVVAVALEDLVLLDADLDVQVTRGAAVGARLAVADRADAHALVDTGWDLHLQRALLLYLAGAVAGGA